MNRDKNIDDFYTGSKKYFHYIGLPLCVMSCKSEVDPIDSK